MCVTLAGGISRERADNLALEEQQALQLPASSADGMGATLAELLPGLSDTAIAPVAPDLIGEAAILITFDLAGRSPAQQAGIVERAWRRAPGETVAAVIRAAQDFDLPDDRQATLGWLRHLADLVNDPLALTDMADQVPTAPTGMIELAGSMHRNAVKLARVKADGSDAGNARLARTLIGLARYLSGLGERDAALAPVEEAVAIRRALAMLRPDAYRPDLAASLSDLAELQGAIGRHDAALGTTEEMIRAYRDLDAARPVTFGRHLAAALNRLAQLLARRGRREAALAAATEMVAIRRRLADAQPDVFRPTLARSLNFLADILSGLGRHEAHLAAISEAVGLYRELAAVRREEFQSRLERT